MRPAGPGPQNPVRFVLISKLRQEVKWLLKATRQWVQEAEALGTKVGPGNCDKCPSSSRFQV